MTLAAALAAGAALGGCGPDSLTGPLPFLTSAAERPSADAMLDEGHRAMAAGDAERALRAFRQAALAGAGPDALAPMGSANLALGRLGQAEPLLRRATEARPGSPEAWNNLGVLLLETGRAGEAAGAFRRAYALGNGASDAVRDNLVLARAATAPLDPPPGIPPDAGAPSTVVAAEPAATP